MRVATVDTRILRLAFTADASRRRRKRSAPGLQITASPSAPSAGTGIVEDRWALSVQADRIENATRPSPFTDNAGSLMAAIASRMSRVELVICGDEVRFAICMRNTAADDHPSMGTGTVGASSIVAPGGGVAKEDLESDVESVLPPGRWLDSAGRHGRQNCCRFIPPSTRVFRAQYKFDGQAYRAVAASRNRIR